MSTFNFTTLGEYLQAVFDALPDHQLITALKAARYNGRPGYSVETMWRTYLVSYVLGLPSFAALIRALHDNPDLRLACGIVSEDAVPSKFAYSRFLKRLCEFRALVEECMAGLANSLRERFPNFGDTIAVDASDVKAFANGRRKILADPDAQWSKKLNTQGRPAWWLGYKLHLICDTASELPVYAYVTPANTWDGNHLIPLIEAAQERCGWFSPKIAIADPGYDSADNFAALASRGVEAVIKENRRRSKTTKRVIDEHTYRHRTSVERAFSSLKRFRKLNQVTVRRIEKVSLHCIASVMSLQATALASLNIGADFDIRSSCRGMI